jgi:hypothetical protein
VRRATALPPERSQLATFPCKKCFDGFAGFVTKTTTCTCLFLGSSTTFVQKSVLSSNYSFRKTGYVVVFSFGKVYFCSVNSFEKMLE